MEIKQLKYFLQICEDKNFSKAAKRLFITQQGLSKAIKVLEEELDAPLFYRTKTGVLLTEYGECLKRKSQTILNEATIILDEIDQLKTAQNRKIDLALSFGVRSALPENFLEAFCEKHPTIQLNIKEYPDYECENALLTDRADIGFTISPIESEDLEYTPIKSDPICLLVNKDNPLARKAYVDFEEIKNEKFIIVNDSFKTYHNFMRRCRRAGFEPTIHMTTMELILIHNRSRANDGIGVSVDFVSNQIPGVKVVRFKDASFMWEICLTTKKSTTLTPAIQQFIDYTLGMSQPLNMLI